MNLILGSESKLKKSAVEHIIQEFANKNILSDKVTILPKIVNQNLPITPFHDETFTFAKERVNILLDLYKNEGDLFIGLESGLIKRYDIWFEECWCVIANTRNNFYYGYSSGLSLPKIVVDRMNAGEKHHDIVNDIDKDGTSKQTWTIYTKGIITREVSIQEAFRNAFYYALGM